MLLAELQKFLDCSSWIS